MMSRNSVLVALTLPTVFALSSVSGALAQAPSVPPSGVPALGVPLRESVPTVSVTGHASLDVVPDTALITIGVVTENAQAATAATENASAVQALIDSLKSQGIAARDIRTVRITLAPVYDESDEPSPRQRKRVLRGYKATNSFVLRVSPTARVGQLAGSLLDKGANMIENIEFDLSNKEGVLSRLREDAMKDALTQAKGYAAPLGLQPGRVLVIQPQNFSGGPIPMMRAAKASFAQADGAAIVPVEPGTQTMELDTQVVFELVLLRP